MHRTGLRPIFSQWENFVSYTMYPHIMKSKLWCCAIYFSSPKECDLLQNTSTLHSTHLTFPWSKIGKYLCTEHLTMKIRVQEKEIKKFLISLIFFDTSDFVLGHMIGISFLSNSHQGRSKPQMYTCEIIRKFGKS